MAVKQRKLRRTRVKIKPVDREQQEEHEEGYDSTPIRNARRILQKGEKYHDEGPIEEIIKHDATPPRGKVVFSNSPFTDVLEDLKVGYAVVITREDAEQFSMRVLKSDRYRTQLSMSWPEFYDMVYSLEYVNFMESWASMDADEKLSYSEKSGAKWKEHDSSQTNLMRACTAVQDVLGIKKYKTEWKSSAKRATIRPRKRR